jgi:hypothetical protein
MAELPGFDAGKHTLNKFHNENPILSVFSSNFLLLFFLCFSQTSSSSVVNNENKLLCDCNLCFREVIAIHSDLDCTRRHTRYSFCLSTSWKSEKE